MAVPPIALTRLPGEQSGRRRSGGEGWAGLGWTAERALRCCDEHDFDIDAGTGTHGVYRIASHCIVTSYRGLLPMCYVQVFCDAQVAAALHLCGAGGPVRGGVQEGLSGAGKQQRVNYEAVRHRIASYYSVATVFAVKL